MAGSDLDAVFFDVMKSSGVVAKELVIEGKWRFLRNKIIGSRAYFYCVEVNNRTSHFNRPPYFDFSQSARGAKLAKTG